MRESATINGTVIIMIRLHECNWQNRAFVCPRSLVLRRIGAGVSRAVHTLVLEYEDGTRTGQNLDNDCSRLPLTDEALSQRGLSKQHWQTIEPGDCIVRISGRHGVRYICHAITFHLASGKNIVFESHHNEWRREEFSCEIPQPGMFMGFSYLPLGRITDFDFASSSLHLWITPANVHNLGSKLERQIFTLVWRTLQQDMIARQRLELPDNLVWKLLSFMRFADIHRAGRQMISPV